jgi:8-oxo-dGTP pyrophosphatase MutT (NUDIX family)
MPLAEFVALHEVSEAECPRIALPAFAVVIALGPGGTVLVFNRYRQVWELPGGLIDAGESPRDAARRELLEEAECRAHDLAWLGMVEISDGARRWASRSRLSFWFGIFRSPGDPRLKRIRTAFYP